MPRWGHVPLAALARGVLAACAPVLPPEPVQRALIRDVARVVEVRDQVGSYDHAFESGGPDIHLVSAGIRASFSLSN